MKIRIVVHQWRRNILLSLFVILQLTAVFVLVVAASSVISHHLQYYTPFADYFRSEGMFMESDGINIDGEYGCQDSKELEQHLRKAEVLSCYAVFCSLKEAGTSGNVMFRSYDEEIIRRYKPKMAAGKWLSVKSSDNSVLHVVVVGNKPDIQVGSVLHAVTMEKEEIPMEVIGIVDEEAVIVGHTNGTREIQDDCRQMYTDLKAVDTMGYTILLNQKEVLAAEKTYKSLGSPMQDMTLIRYDKDISEEDVEYNRQYIEENAFPQYKASMSEINSTSEKNIRTSLYFFIPIVVAAFVLTMVSAICSNAIILRGQLHDYAVYNLCGMKWNRCILVNLFSIVVSTAIAAGAAGVVIVCVIQGKDVLMTTILFQKQEFFCCAGTALLYILLSMIQPYILLHRQSAKSVLVKNQD